MFLLRAFAVAALFSRRRSRSDQLAQNDVTHGKSDRGQRNRVVA